MKEKKAAPSTLASGQQGQKPVTAIDWTDIHHRLESARTALERILVPGLAKKQAVLKARAKSLAQENKVMEGAEQHLEVVEFLLAYEKYGIESSYVREIYPLKELTPLPCTPAFVLGLINVRGQSSRSSTSKSSLTSRTG